MCKRILWCLLTTLLCLAIGGQDRCFASQRINTEPQMIIDHIGPVKVPFSVPSAALFTFPGDIVSGTVNQSPYPLGYVQLVIRSDRGTWAATTSVVSVARKLGGVVVRWSLPMMTLECRDRNVSYEIVAVLAGNRLPVGHLSDITWGNLTRSESVVVTCAQFDTSALSVVEVGRRLVRASESVRVSHFEDVKVVANNAPPGAIVQLCVQPVDNAAIWCQDSFSVIRGPAWLGGASFGRIDLVRGPNGLEFRDAYTRFWVRAYLVRAPLPIRPGGILPDEWLGLRTLILKESDLAEATRAYRPGQVRIDIVTLGDTNDGRVRLARPVTHVEGEFKPLPGYQRKRREVITLLTRQSTDNQWKISGAAVLGGDVTRWLITVADLNPQNGPVTSERIAIAVLSNDYLPNGPVTEELLRNRATSISDEMVFRLYQR